MVRVKYSDELCHSGIKGQKWGVRRYQNEDGSLTPEGRKRYGVGERVRSALSKGNSYAKDGAYKTASTAKKIGRGISNTIGKRKYVNRDGSLTAKGVKKYGPGEAGIRSYQDRSRTNREYRRLATSAVIGGVPGAAAGGLMGLPFFGVGAIPGAAAGGLAGTVTAYSINSVLAQPVELHRQRKEEDKERRRYEQGMMSKKDAALYEQRVAARMAAQEKARGSGLAWI